MAVIAYPPSAVTVFISAWMPAPPDESEPAIINILDLGFNYFIEFFIILIHFIIKLLSYDSAIILIFGSVPDFLTKILPF